MNPADLPTKGLLAKELANSKLWAEGPGTIQCEESTWPPQLPNEPVEESIDKDERKKSDPHDKRKPKKQHHRS